MMDRAETGGGFSVLDGVALVTGAAVASVHFRTTIRDGMTSFGWVLIWGTFTWVAVTASGPFLFLAHRFARRSTGYPKIGDSLWALLGLPWLITAIVRATVAAADPRHNELFATVLSTSLAAASLISLAMVWRTWVMVPPDQAARAASSPWTNRVGLILAIAWPIQCGIGMVVVS